MPRQRHRMHKPLAEIGLWHVHKWLKRVEDAGGDAAALVYVAAQMKRQGYPPEITAAILGRAPVCRSPSTVSDPQQT